MHERLVIPRKSTRTVETPQCWSLGKQWLGFCFSVFSFLRWGTPWKGLNWKDQTQVKINFCSSFPLPPLAVFSLENPLLTLPSPGTANSSWPFYLGLWDTYSRKPDPLLHLFPHSSLMSHTDLLATVQPCQFSFVHHPWDVCSEYDGSVKICLF